MVEINTGCEKFDKFLSDDVDGVRRFDLLAQIVISNEGYDLKGYGLLSSDYDGFSKGISHEDYINLMFIRGMIKMVNCLDRDDVFDSFNKHVNEYYEENRKDK